MKSNEKLGNKFIPNHSIAFGQILCTQRYQYWKAQEESAKTCCSAYQ